MCYVDVDIDWAAMEDDEMDNNICPDCNFELIECICHDHELDGTDNDTCTECGCDLDSCVCYVHG